jgi:hypothetical protein
MHWQEEDSAWKNLLRFYSRLLVQFSRQTDEQIHFCCQLNLAFYARRWIHKKRHLNFWAALKPGETIQQSFMACKSQQPPLQARLNRIWIFYKMYLFIVFVNLLPETKHNSSLLSRIGPQFLLLARYQINNTKLQLLLSKKKYRFLLLISKVVKTKFLSNWSKASSF